MCLMTLKADSTAVNIACTCHPRILGDALKILAAKRVLQVLINSQCCVIPQEPGCIVQ